MATGKLIEEGKKIFDKYGTEVRLNHLISDKGGQGDVYHATYKGRDYALKWYKEDENGNIDLIGSELYKSLSKIHGEANKPSGKFIWPLVLVTENNHHFVDGKHFGYLMELLPKGYYEMQDFLCMDSDPNSARFSNYNAQFTACMNVVSAMRELHLKMGCSYKDLNPNNFMFNPNTGDILVVDNDNVSVDGAPCSVKGMKGYMAPEIPRSKYKESPSIQTDLFSLAVVLYRILFIDHPMEGKAWAKFPVHGDREEEFLYSIKPVFHYNPDDASNRPIDEFTPNVKERWFQVPLELRELFIQSFTVGIDEPEKRVTDRDWIKVFSKVRGRLVRYHQDKEQFVDFQQKETIPPRCLGMLIDNDIYAVYPKKALYANAVGARPTAYGECAGGFVYNKATDQIMIRNLSNKVWRCYSPETKTLVTISQNEEHPVYHGVQIEFNKESPKVIGKIFDPRKI